LAQQAWIDASGELGRTLRRLETLAVRPPEEHGSGSVDELTRLQHALHRLSERYASHPDLSAALESARDATRELVETAAGSGWRAAAPLVYEWRGALFRVRLERMALARPVPDAAPDEPDRDLRPALTSLCLTTAGGAAFVGGAVLATWPLWAAGMLAVVAGLLVYRP
jgi:hypothetical protein